MRQNVAIFVIVRGKDRLDLYGAKAFSCEQFPADEHGLRAPVAPAQEPLPILSDAEERATADTFQSLLLRYRMVNYGRVTNNRIDCREFTPEMREEARAWLAPILDCPELSKSIRAEIGRQSEAVAEHRFFDPRCVVAEAALAICHRANVEHFLVGELTELVNALLKGRHEETELSAKKVGLVLRDLVIHGTRVAEGFRIGLTEAVRKHIHELAYSYQVLSVSDGTPRCSYCRDQTVH